MNLIVLLAVGLMILRVSRVSQLLAIQNHSINEKKENGIFKLQNAKTINKLMLSTKTTPYLSLYQAGLKNPNTPVNT